MMKGKVYFPAWLSNWFVSDKDRRELSKAAELTGSATRSKTYLWGLIEIGVEAELVDNPEGTEK